MTIDRDFAIIDVTAEEASAYATNPNAAAMVQQAAQELAERNDATDRGAAVRDAA